MVDPIFVLTSEDAIWFVCRFGWNWSRRCTCWFCRGCAHGTRKGRMVRILFPVLYNKRRYIIKTIYVLELKSLNGHTIVCAASFLVSLLIPRSVTVLFIWISNDSLSFSFGQARLSLINTSIVFVSRIPSLDSCSHLCSAL